eukprot:CAMPEP_0119339388 /NCGR_PEP_ID=MMETSP1333-20130426/98149_1 /TAXON_ID=418940 /ORGANISM="Scyphosphaera apsteinii, Strain RCC1455" /LENGTH=99 /DNA_ID=CAMNT_0007350891 /DNA_START=321 /DNA_END=618 /DNA_ORIENTATION=-
MEGPQSQRSRLLLCARWAQQEMDRAVESPLRESRRRRGPCVDEDALLDESTTYSKESLASRQSALDFDTAAEATPPLPQPWQATRRQVHDAGCTDAEDE